MKYNIEYQARLKIEAEDETEAKRKADEIIDKYKDEVEFDYLDDNTSKITSYHCEAGCGTCTVNTERIGSCGSIAGECVFRGDRIDIGGILLERWDLCFKAEDKHSAEGDHAEALRFEARRIEVESIMRRSNYSDHLPELLSKVHKRDVIYRGHLEED